MQSIESPEKPTSEMVVDEQPVLNIEIPTGEEEFYGDISQLVQELGLGSKERESV